MLRLLLLFALLAFLVPAPSVSAQECQSYSYEYNPGKTVTGFYGEATDGCHVAKWTGSIGQGPGSGTVTFRTTDNIYPGTPGYSLPSKAGGHENACKARAARTANLYFTNMFAVPLGTEVTVKYRCD